MYLDWKLSRKVQPVFIPQSSWHAPSGRTVRIGRQARCDCFRQQHGYNTSALTTVLEAGTSLTLGWLRPHSRGFAAWCTCEDDHPAYKSPKQPWICPSLVRSARAYALSSRCLCPPHFLYVLQAFGCWRTKTRAIVTISRSHGLTRLAPPGVKSACYELESKLTSGYDLFQQNHAPLDSSVAGSCNLVSACDGTFLFDTSYRIQCTKLLPPPMILSTHLVTLLTPLVVLLVQRLCHATSQPTFPQHPNTPRCPQDCPNVAHGHGM